MKPHHWIILTIAGIAAGACGRFPDMAVTTTTPVPQATSVVVPTRPPLSFPDRVVITSSSLSFQVDDPPATLAELQVLVEEAGGFVSSASSWSDPQNSYASLSAKVPPAALAGLRRATIELASGVQNNSSYSQDVTFEVQSLRERLSQIDEAEDRLLAVLLTSGDASLAKSYVLIAQLFQQERQNAESQLENYLESSTLSSFDVTLNGQPAIMRQDMEATPLPYLQ